jgi:uncharacterized protein (AIM24 family)
MSDFRKLVDEKTGRGVKFELYDVSRLDKITERRSQVGRQIKITLTGGSAALEPGALQYSIGHLQIEVQKNDASAGFFKRHIQAKMAGESAYSTIFRGNGVVFTELTTKHFIIAEMDGPGDALILDDKAFYACEGTIALKTHVNNNMSGIISGLAQGNGLMQPKLEGAGVFVVESPVPVDEIEAVELDGTNELIVDGDLILMYSASLQVQLRPLVSGLRNAWRSGEGAVFVMKGRGTVWLLPTSRVMDAVIPSPLSGLPKR